uniref:Tyrosine decarboxylase n=2 Tax=Caenorhabditis japonica TaxID=281687 RepID=A0A8R1E8J8_CAEJA
MEKNCFLSRCQELNRGEMQHLLTHNLTRCLATPRIHNIIFSTLVCYIKELTGDKPATLTSIIWDEKKWVGRQQHDKTREEKKVMRIAVWAVRDRFKLTQALVVDPLYLQHSWMDKSIDYRHWGIPLSRRFRSLKLWFVIRMYGIDGLQKYIREHVRLAKKMETLLKADAKFEIVNEVIMGLVCFRMKGDDELNQTLLTKLNASGRIHMVPASLGDRFVIRFCVCAENATDKDIEIAYEIIAQAAQHVLNDSVKAVIAEEDEEAVALEEMVADLNIEETPDKNSANADTGHRMERQLSKEEILAQKQNESLAKKRYLSARPPPLVFAPETKCTDPDCSSPILVSS